MVVVLVVAGIVAAYALGFIGNASPAEPPPEKSIYEFEVKDIDGKPVRLGDYKGKVLLFVNTASKCGYTSQYEGLEKIYDKYKDRGFVVLGFPANNFMGQEPGTEQEIKEFCQLKYDISFPMFAKISVKGADQHPLYTYLTNPKTNPNSAGEITWNFNKFLVDRNGNIVARFGTKETPESQNITGTIEKHLDEK
jgi:glutathione peroxidase